MQLRKLGTSDLMISKLSIGTWGMGADFFGTNSEQDSIEALRAALDAGVNFIDTAPVYGRGYAEKVVGKALKGYTGHYLIGTKCGVIAHSKDGDFFHHILDPMMIEAEVDQSLKRLGVECIDLYQMHYPDEHTPIEESMDTLKGLQKAGKIRYIGASNFTPAQLEEARKYGEVVSLQPRYSYIDREFEEEGLGYCMEKGMGVLTFGSLHGGMLSGKYRELPVPSDEERRWTFYSAFNEPKFTRVKQLLEQVKPVAQRHDCPLSHVMMAWVADHPGITSALVGIKNTAQAQDLAKAMELTLTNEDRDEMERAYRDILGGQ